MTDALTSNPVWPLHAHDAAGTVAALCDTVRQTAAVAVGLAESGRRLDVAGLDRTVGLLCAKALDLPPAEGRMARIGLITLLAEMNALGVALRPVDPS